MNAADGQAFWAFSLAVYGDTGVAEACLGLQDRHDIDVNLLLFACWIGTSGNGRLDEDQWRRLIGDTHAWRQDVVEPLRNVRRRLKTGSWPGVEAQTAADLREAVKRLELEAERAEQLGVAAFYATIPDASRPEDRRRADAAANIAGYAAALGVMPTERDRADMDRIVAASLVACDKM